MKRWASLLGATLLGAATVWIIFAEIGPASANAKAGADETASYSVRTLALPDNNLGDVSMDYIAYDPATNSVWVPGGNTGAVDVVDASTSNARQISGFATKEVEGRGGKRIREVGSAGLGWRGTARRVARGTWEYRPRIR